MRYRFTAVVGAAIVAAAAAAAIVTMVSVAGQTRPAPPAAPAARRSRMPDGKPNLNGIWQAVNSANWDVEDHEARQGPVTALGASFSVPPGMGIVEGGTIPYRPEALAKKKENQANWLARDPEIKCYMPGIPRATYQGYPFQIVQTGKDIQFWMGWSFGRWDGDTLVVDVTGFTDQTWFDRAGNFHSDELHVVERYTPLDADHLTYEATIEDPKTFTRPWKISMPLYRRVEKNAQLLEYICVEYAEELMYGHLSKRPTP